MNSRINIGDIVSDSRTGQTAVVIRANEIFTWGIENITIAYNQNERPKHADSLWCYNESSALPDLAICYAYRSTATLEEMLMYPNPLVRQLGAKLFHKQQQREKWLSWWKAFWQ